MIIGKVRGRYQSRQMFSENLILLKQLSLRRFLVSNILDQILLGVLPIQSQHTVALDQIKRNI